MSYTLSGATTGSGNGTGSGSKFNVGVTTVTVTATNSCGSDTETFTVTVRDMTAPLGPTLADATGECSVTVAAPTTTDNCAGTVTGTTTNPTTYTQQGTYTITWSFSDGNGNTSTATQQVIVKDVTAPVLTAGNDQEVNLGENCSVVIPDVRGTASDNCDGAVITQSPAAGTVVMATDGQVIEVQVTATDVAGNTDAATVKLTAQDVTRPTITAPAGVEVVANASCQATEVALGTPTASDNCAGVTVTNNAPATFQLGETVVTWTATDGAGLTATTTQTVTVVDRTAPELTPIATVRGECSATVTEAPTAEDNCGGTITGTTQDPLTYTQQGEYKITWSFNDGNGNIATAVQEVIVEDVTAPVVPILADAVGECSVTVTTPTTTDNCAGTITGTTSDPITYTEQGTYTITWTFDDGNGNTATATQRVVVDDVTAPVIAAAEPVTAEADAGQCGARLNITAPEVTDNCAANPATGTRSDGAALDAQYPVGTTTITWNATDANGNESVAVTQRVTVTDTQAPTITAPAPVRVAANASCEATNVELGTPITADNCSVASVTNNAPETFKLGETEVIWTVTDAAGLTSTAKQLVTVLDQTAPVAPVIAAATGECAVTVTAVPTAEDNCNGTITGTTQDPLTYSQQGRYEITWSFDDGNGNIATAIQEVIVDDVTAPVQPTLADATGECSVTVTAPTTTDNCAGTITGTTTDPTTYEEQGTYTITWTFNDGNGNTTTATQQVIVKDVTAPVIAAAEPVTAPADQGQCGATLTITAPEVTDNCEARPATGTRSDGAALDAQYPVGTTTITWNATDANGNEAVAVTQTVTVTDTQAPTITAPANVEVAADASCQASNVELGTPTTSDNCSVASVTNNAPETFELGETEVTWTVTDAAGLTATATQLVTVVDRTAPVLTAAADQEVSLGAECSVTIPDVRGTATDNCSAATITQSPAAGTTVAATDGETITVLVTATDAAGNKTTDEVVLTAQDVTAPVLAAAADQAAGTDNGTCTATIAIPDASFSDNCAGSQISWVMTGATTGNGKGQVGRYTFNQGVTTITYTATDAAGNTATDQLQVTVTDDDAPVVTVPANMVVQTQPDKCGAVVNYNVTASDNCSAVTPKMTTGLASGATFPVGTTTVTYEATDEAGNTTTQSFTVTVENKAPSNLVITGPVSPVQQGSEVTLTATFEDENIATAVWNWGNGSTTTQAITGSPISATYKYSQPGVYSVELTVTDHCGQKTTAVFNYVVVYDPNGGFVTGGGWIDSPPGAYVADPTLVGKANFGFNAKYKKGSNEVDGHTEFHFKAGDLNFKSSAHDAMTLVVAGYKAMYKGVGSINGNDNYAFMVSVVDGNLKGQAEADRFRIKIWDRRSGAIVYDNQLGAVDNADATTSIGGGSIVIHENKAVATTPKTSKVISEELEGISTARFDNYPNAFSDRTTIRFSLDTEQNYELEVYDIRGALVKKVGTGTAEAGKVYEYELDGRNLAEGVYFARLATGSGIKTIKMLLKK
ncbi:HYR domain-containing protein [Pontibacter sp. HJ8]